MDLKTHSGLTVSGNAQEIATLLILVEKTKKEQSPKSSSMRGWSRKKLDYSAMADKAYLIVGQNPGITPTKLTGVVHKKYSPGVAQRLTKKLASDKRFLIVGNRRKKIYRSEYWK